MNDQKKTTTAPDPHALEEAVGSLFEVGRMWASHGLKLAEMALETSAKTLHVTAEVLGDASERFEESEAK